MTAFMTRAGASLLLAMIGTVAISGGARAADPADPYASNNGFYPPAEFEPAAFRWPI